MHIVRTILEELRQPGFQQRHARQMTRVYRVELHRRERLGLVLVVLFIRHIVRVLPLLLGDSLLLFLRDLLPDRAALVEVLVHAEVCADARTSELHTGCIRQPSVHKGAQVGKLTRGLVRRVA